MISCKIAPRSATISDELSPLTHRHTMKLSCVCARAPGCRFFSQSIGHTRVTKRNRLHNCACQFSLRWDDFWKRLFGNARPQPRAQAPNVQVNNCHCGHHNSNSFKTSAPHVFDKMLYLHDMPVCMWNVKFSELFLCLLPPGKKLFRKVLFSAASV